MPVVRDSRGRFTRAPEQLQPRPGMWARIIGDSSWNYRHYLEIGTPVRLVEEHTFLSGPGGRNVWAICMTPYDRHALSIYGHVVLRDLELLEPNAECPIGCPDGCGFCRPDEYRNCLSGRHRVPTTEELCECGCEALCGHCNSRTLIGRLRRITVASETVRLCTTCVGNLEYCDDCSIWSYPEDPHRCPAWHECDACNRGPYRPGTRVIDSYSYSPDLVFHGDGPLYFGIEMEMEIPVPHRTETVARHLLNMAGGVVFAKSDGSLNRGIELVTHPVSFDYIMGCDRLWSALDSIRELWGVDNTPNAGLHVHVSREGFSGTSHLYRWIKFFHRNESDVVRIARRRTNQWAAFTPENRQWAAHIAKHGQYAPSTNPDREWYAQQKPTWGWADGGRYRAINNTNPETLEVRVFAGSVYPQEIRAAIQLVHGSIEYMRTVPTKKIIETGYGWDAFLDWAREQGTYSDLLRLDSMMRGAWVPAVDEDDSDHGHCSCGCQCDESCN